MVKLEDVVSHVKADIEAQIKSGIMSAFTEGEAALVDSPVWSGALLRNWNVSYGSANPNPIIDDTEIPGSHGGFDNYPKTFTKIATAVSQFDLDTKNAIFITNPQPYIGQLGYKNVKTEASYNYGQRLRNSFIYGSLVK